MGFNLVVSTYLQVTYVHKIRRAYIHTYIFIISNSENFCFLLYRSNKDCVNGLESRLVPKTCTVHTSVVNKWWVNDGSKRTN